MTRIALSTSDWRRDVAAEAQVPLLNRYFEINPVVVDGPVALLARPGMKKWKQVGNGPIRGMFSQLGVFDNALFVVSNATLFKIDPDETITTIGTGIAGADGDYVSMCATDDYLFLADGSNLWIYSDNGFAVGTLTSSANAANNETVTIGSTVYKFTTGSVDAGTPAGTGANPWLVAVGASTSDSMQNLADAINDSGTAGTQYSTVLTAHPDVSASSTATAVIVHAKVAGTAGNAIATTETCANAAWGGATLSGGGAATFTTVPMPDDVGAVWVDTIASFVIVVVAQGFGMNGRFYWISPGENFIDPLNFATAERAPDPIYSVMTLGDQFWLFGSSTTEVWYPTGDGDAPFQRIQGRLFDRGIWGGTAVKIGDEMILTDRDGVVWQIGQGVERVSNNGVEQRIRESMALELRA